MMTTKCPPPKWRSSRLPSPNLVARDTNVKKEEQGIYEIDDAKCKMGTVDIKLDKDYTVILISRY